MATRSETKRVRTHAHNTRVDFAELNEPGSYINDLTGNLYRVPEDALVSGRSPLIEIVSDEPTMMTKISDNPWLPISKARQMAADCDLNVAF